MKEYTLWYRILAWIGFVTLFFIVLELLFIFIFPEQFINLAVKILTK